MFATLFAFVLLGQIALDDPTATIDAFAKAVEGGNPWLIAAAGVGLLVFLLRRFVPGKFGNWLRTDLGGALLSLTVSFAGALATKLATGGAITLGVVVAAIGVAFTASGGWSLIRRLLQRRPSEGSGGSAGESGTADPAEPAKATWP